MENTEYNLDFYEAFKLVMQGNWVKGDNFIDGIFLKLNKQGQLVITDAARLYDEDTRVFLKGMVNQKFREIKVATMHELSK